MSTLKEAQHLVTASAAQGLANELLEDYDQHVKAHERIKKWDGAMSTYHDLFKLKQKAMKIYGEMGVALGYERALAYAGVSKDDVEHQIRGSQIGATHNYKVKRKVKLCTNKYKTDNGCTKPLRLTATECPYCQSPVKDAEVPISPSDLRDKLGRHVVGVELKNGRFVWFQEPVAADYRPPEE